jgi:hypothetical protein
MAGLYFVPPPPPSPPGQEPPEIVVADWDRRQPGLWIRVSLIRIRIQHFCSIRIQFRIRIQAKTELSKTISFSNFFEIKIWVQSNQKYRCYSSNFFFKK